MRIRNLLFGATFLAILPLGCTEAPVEQVPPANPPVVAPEKTDKGVAVSKKHTLPTGADPSFVSPGP